MCINREGAPLIWTHYSLKQVCKREKERERGSLERRSSFFCLWGLSYLGLALHLVTKSILNKLLGFLPCDYREKNICVILSCCDFISFSDPISYGYDEMMLNV